MLKSDALSSLKNFDEALAIATKLSQGDFIPECFKNKPYATLAAIETARAVGLNPIIALGSMYPNDSSIEMYGRNIDALVLSSPELKNLNVKFDDQTMTCIVTIERDGFDPHVEKYSKQDAITAGLWNKNRVWRTNPKDMLRRRCLCKAYDLLFSHVLLGLTTKEVNDDIRFLDTKDEHNDLVHDNKLPDQLKLPDKSQDKITPVIKDSKHYQLVKLAFCLPHVGKNYSKVCESYGGESGILYEEANDLIKRSCIKYIKHKLKEPIFHRFGATLSYFDIFDFDLSEGIIINDSSIQQTTLKLLKEFDPFINHTVNYERLSEYEARVYLEMCYDQKFSFEKTDRYKHAKELEEQLDK